jgi:hypothetical protein
MYRFVPKYLILQMKLNGSNILLTFLAGVALTAAVGCCAGCKSQPPAPPPKTAAVAPADKEWTPDEIAKDPESYMKWADAQVAKQIGDRKSRLASLSARLVDIQAKRQTLQEKLDAVKNIHDRMETAMRRADDEDRWPLQMGGQSYEQSEAKAIVEQSSKYIEDRRSLAVAYDQAVEKVQAMSVLLTAQVEDLNRLRERLALDLERVRLSQGMEELENLKKTTAEISGYAKTVGTMADETLNETLPEDKSKESDKVDIESMLGKKAKTPGK